MEKSKLGLIAAALLCSCCSPVTGTAPADLEMPKQIEVVFNHNARSRYRQMITGSFNWSPSAAHTNDETLLMIHSPELVKHFTREMNRLWDTAELGITARMRRSKLDRQKIRCGEGVERR